MIELVSAPDCIGCDKCVDVCPTDVFDRTPSGVPVIARQSDCQTCFMCEAYCPTDALYVHPLVMVHCPNCGAGTIVSDNLAWYEFDENTIDYNNKIREHSLKDVTTKFEVTPQELKDLGLYDKVMERKAKYDAEHPNGDEDEDD